jgi:hypothetical protein
MAEELRTKDGIPASLLYLVLLGRAEQRCRACGLEEAAGAYCSRCNARMAPVRDWRDGGHTLLPPPSREELELIVSDFDHGGPEEF